MASVNNWTRLLPCSLLLAYSACVTSAQQLPAIQEPPAAELGPLAAAPVAKRPAEMTPNAPRVKCQGDQLSIAAENATLRSVLAAVQGCTGLQIDIPSELADDRTYLQLGPGLQSEVMEALLSSTELDYIIQPSNSDHGKIAKIVLTMRMEDSSEKGRLDVASNHDMTPARRAWMASRNTGRPVAKTTDDEQSQVAESEPADEAAPEVSPTKNGEAAAAPAATDAAASKSQAADDKAPAKAAATSGAEAAAPAPDTATAPAQADSTQESSGAKELQNKITDMQQLFEQRKKIAADSGSSTKPDQN